LDGQTLSFVPLDPPSFREVLQDSSAPRLDERNCPTKEEACHERAGRRNGTGSLVEAAGRITAGLLAIEEGGTRLLAACWE